jgi:hypothetical protein
MLLRLRGTMGHGEREEDENDSTQRLCLLPMEDLRLRLLFCLVTPRWTPPLLVGTGSECRWKLFRLPTGVLATALARSAILVSRVACLVGVTPLGSVELVLVIRDWGVTGLRLPSFLLLLEE